MKFYKLISLLLILYPLSSEATLKAVSSGISAPSGTSGGIPYYPTSNTQSSTGVLGANQVIVGGGAGQPPSSTTVTINGSGKINAPGGISTGSAGTASSFSYCDNATPTPNCLVYTPGGATITPGTISGFATSAPPGSGSYAWGANNGTFAWQALAGGTITLSGDASGSGTSSIAVTNTGINGSTIPASTTVLGTNSSRQIIAATVQGNGAKVQLSTGTTTTNDCAGYDVSGNIVDQGFPCGSGTGTVNSVTASAPLTSSGGSTPVISATYQGNGAKIQASTGSTTTNDCVKYDSNGNTVDAGAACAGTAPPSATLGSLVVTGGGAVLNAPFASSKQTCASGKQMAWPLSGYFVSTSSTINSAQALATGMAVLSGQANGTSCAFNSLAYGIAPNPSLGAVIDNAPADNFHLNPFAQFTFTGSTGLNSISSQFVADIGSNIQVIGTIPQAATTASSTQYLGFGGGAFNATELNVAIPVPFAATAQYLTECNSTIPTATVAVAFRDNGSSVGPTVTIPSTTSGCNGYDGTNTASVAAGDYIDFQTISGATTQTNINSLLVTLKAVTGNPEMIWGYIDNTASTTLNYSQPETGATGTVFINEQIAIPRACTASNLYVVQATANVGLTTTFTLYRVAAGSSSSTPSATALTGTVTALSGTGSLLLDGTDTVALAAGDRIALGYITGAGVSGTIAGWSFKCQ